MMGEMPPLSLPPPSPEVFSTDPIYHRDASAQVNEFETKQKRKIRKRRYQLL
jgi:hypothetical protein